MANPTTNFGWQMPTATDLVTDLPADFEVFGQAVDTAFADLKGGTTGQVLAKASGTDLDFVWSADAAGMTNPMTTTGDVIYSSSGSTPDRLGIGTVGQVLTVNSGATAPEWAALPGGSSYTLVNAGGTALTGAQTITISGITSADKIQIVIVGASSASALSFFYLYFNADTSANYQYGGMSLTGNDSYSATQFSTINSDPNTKIRFARQSNDVGGTVNGYCIINGANSTNPKMFNYVGAGENVAGGSAASGRLYSAGGSYAGASTISSVTFESATGNFDAGTIYVYKTA